MIVSGKIISSVRRGGDLIKKYEPRLIGALGFRPFHGTLNIKLGKDVDVQEHSTKTIEFILTDGKRKVDAYLAPVRVKALSERMVLRDVPIEGDEMVTLYKWKGKDAFSLRKMGKFVTWDIIRSDADRQMIEYLIRRQECKSTGAPEKSKIRECDCWAIKLVDGPQDESSAEIIAKIDMRDKMGLKDDDSVQIEFLR